jgi:hypothetical protein
MQIGSGNASKELVEGVSRSLQGRDDEAAAFHTEVDLGARIERGFEREGFGDSQGEAVAPLLNADAHRLLLVVSTMKIPKRISHCKGVVSLTAEV